MTVILRVGSSESRVDSYEGRVPHAGDRITPKAPEGPTLVVLARTFDFAERTITLDCLPVVA